MNTMPETTTPTITDLPKSVLILGSGALKIGQAGEFDYSGSQAIKAFKEEGIRTVLINPNIATIQTSELLADEVYFLPVTDHFVEEVIKKEKPDAIALSFGGQTGLNTGLSLEKKGILKKYGVRVLGTSFHSIEVAEDRDLFAKHVRAQKMSTPISKAAHTVEEALEYAEELGYPVMTRAAFALGGQSSGVIRDKEQMKLRMKDAFAFTTQVLVEQYLHHWKEVEYEIVRDQYDNCVAVCNMENFDPLGIHTGESIVIAPSQTLTNFEYHYLRSVSIELVRSLNIVGECNVQFALNPNPEGEIEYSIIELNPRLSRSSALASKATGYPLAYVAAKLILGKALSDVKNQMTQVTQSFFEPALDYLVVKVPRWDLNKFKDVEDIISSGMKSVGEVMAIGRSFEEAVQKAVRMLDIDVEGVTDYDFSDDEFDYEHYVNTPTPRRIFAICMALAKGHTVKDLYKITGVDPWFLYRLEAIVQNELNIRTQAGTQYSQKCETPVHHNENTPQSILTPDALRELKENGFSDKYIGGMVGLKGLDIRAMRKAHDIVPAIFKIDTLAGEFPAQANYLYMTYHGSHHDVDPFGKSGVVVLGSGPYRIGSSVEFDWTCVNTANYLKKHNKQSIIVNCNPETVSTDYDISDRLYFEELTFERVADIYEFENPEGVIVSVGGQRPNTLAFSMSDYGFHILGTPASSIDTAEDRSKFSQLLDDIGVSQPAWQKLASLEGAATFAEDVGYPVLIRPSYVLSGSAMSICYNKKELDLFLSKSVVVNQEYPVTVSKFFENAKEIELDGVAQNGQIMVSAVSEHIEEAGVHSGDATIAYPPQRVFLQTEKMVNEIGAKLVKALNITGPFNIQFLAKENKVSVIETNLRASRTIPFISKATGVNFAEVIVDAFYGQAQPKEIVYPPYVVVKSPQFSFSRLEGADPVLRVEMASTGEAACFGDDVEEAFLKAELSTGAKIPEKGIFVSLGGEENKVRFLNSLWRMKDWGLPLYATEQTAEFMKKNGIPAIKLHKIHENKSPNFLDYFQDGKIDLAINIVDANHMKDIDDDYRIRRATVDHNIYLLTNRRKAEMFVKSVSERKVSSLKVKSWREYRDMLGS